MLKLLIDIIGLLADPGKARAALQKALSFFHTFSNPFPPTALLRRHAKTVGDSFSSCNKDYVIVIKNFLNLKGHQNPINGSEVTVILLKRWIWPICGVA